MQSLTEPGETARPSCEEQDRLLASAWLQAAREQHAHTEAGGEGGASPVRRGPPAAGARQQEELHEKQLNGQTEEDAPHPPAATPMQHREHKKQRGAAVATALNKEEAAWQFAPVQRRLVAPAPLKAEEVQRFIDAFVPAELQEVQAADGEELGPDVMRECILSMLTELPATSAFMLACAAGRPPPAAPPLAAPTAQMLAPPHLDAAGSATCADFAAAAAAVAAARRGTPDA